MANDADHDDNEGGASLADQILEAIDSGQLVYTDEDDVHGQGTPVESGVGTGGDGMNGPPDRPNSDSDRYDLFYVLGQLRCVFDELHEYPEGLLPPQLRSHYHRAYATVDEQFTEILGFLAGAPTPEYGYGLSGELLRAKTDLLVASMEQYRDARATAGLPVRRVSRSDTANPIVGVHAPGNRVPAKPAKFRTVRKWLKHLMGVASPMLGSVAEAFPPIKVLTEGLSEICNYVGGSCELLDLVEETFS